MEAPQYSIEDIMKLLKRSEPAVRKLLNEAGIGIDVSRNNPEETIRYEDFRRFWVSRANRPEGRLLATLLVEESDNWFSRLTQKRK